MVALCPEFCIYSLSELQGHDQGWEIFLNPIGTQYRRIEYEVGDFEDREESLAWELKSSMGYDITNLKKM